MSLCICNGGDGSGLGFVVPVRGKYIVINGTSVSRSTFCSTRSWSSERVHVRPVDFSELDEQ